MRLNARNLRLVMLTSMDRRVFLGLAALAALGGFATWRAFDADLARARARLANRGAKVATRFGDIEYATAGSGPPVLMVHGTGGGFDQGLAFAARLSESGYRVIAPSRFGYLGSAFPAEPSSEHQADAFADLLGALDIARIPVVGGSAGALSALQFAIRHPKRCSALVPIVPATYAPNRPPLEQSALTQAIIAYALRSDFLFWSGLVTMPDAMTAALLATDPALVAAASADEQARVRQILWDILPVIDRADGLLNDAKLAGNPAPMALEQIRAPTLAISLEDDRFGTFDAARHIAATVPGARLVSYPSGGHVWVGHDQEIFAVISDFLRDK
jgi:pimeloyl-ACP methyl ester carboxylesterase